MNEDFCSLAGVAGGGGNDCALADQQFPAHFDRSAHVILADKRFRLSWLPGVSRRLFFTNLHLSRRRQTSRREEAINATGEGLSRYRLRGRLLGDFR